MPALTTQFLRSLFETSTVSGQKCYRNGTHRTVNPEHTLHRIAPLLNRMGITRVADITGLDRIGIPVIMVTRPNSRSLAVSQGKGLSLTSARVSGIMESVETYHAERINRPLKLASYNELVQTDNVVDVSRLAKSREHTFNDDVRTLWIQGINLLNGDVRWLPFESVHADFSWPRVSGSGYFPANTNGLASGNEHIEAVAHALYEVLERDALSLSHLSHAPLQCIDDLDQINDDDCRHVLNTLESAGMDVKIWDVTSDTGIACFECLIISDDERYADPEFGSGCHPDKHVALLRALTEAVQARTTFIAGSRDDYGSEPYTDTNRHDRLNSGRQLLHRKDKNIKFTDISDHSTDNIFTDVKHVLNTLQSLSISEVMWVDLTLPDLAIPVARVVVPGLEGAFKGSNSDYVAGDRAARMTTTRSSTE